MYAGSMRRILTITLCTLAIIGATPLANSANKIGGSCKSAGGTTQIGGVKAICVTTGSKLIWQKATTSKQTTVAATSDTSKCKLKIATNRGDVAVGGFPRYSIRLRSTGVVTAKVIMVDFSDAVASKTPQQAFAMISKSSQIFDEVSYGKFTYKFDPVYKWYRMSKPAKSYAPLNQSFDNHFAYISEAIKLADGDVDFKDTESFIILANPDAKSLGDAGPAFSPNDKNWGIKVDGTVLTNGATSAYDLNYWSYIWLNHEITHTLGMVDLYAFSGDAHRFVGEFGYMGLSSLESNSPSLLAWERWLLNWLDDNQIFCLSSGSTQQKLTPIQSKSGLKAVITPLGNNKVLVAESRRAIGIDNKLSKSGVLVYTVDSTIESGFGPIKIYPLNNSDSKKNSAPLGVNEQITVEGVSIKVLSADSSGDLIQVTK